MLAVVVVGDAAEDAGVVFPGPAVHGWDRSATVEVPAAAAGAIHDQGRVARISGVRQRVALVISVLPALTAEAKRKMPKLRIAPGGRIHGKPAELIGRTPALTSRVNAPVIAMIDKVNAVIIVMIGRIIEVIAGKMAVTAAMIGGIISATAMWVEKLLRAMQYMMPVTDGVNTGMIEETGMKTTGAITTSTTILQVCM
jgi:hypothetical protein